MRIVFLAIALLAGWRLGAAERAFNFGDTPQDKVPPGFRSAVGGGGKPGDWKVVGTEVPPTMPAISSNAPSVSGRPVLAQTARDPMNFHFPMLIYDNESF